MIYSLRAFFTVGNFFIGGIVPELYQRAQSGSQMIRISGTIPPIKKLPTLKNALRL